MAFQVIWAQSALADLEQIVRYIAVEDSGAARRLGLTLINRAEELARFPRKGRIVPEKGEEALREIIVVPYRVVYEISDADRTVRVLRIWHSTRGTPEVR